MTEPQKIPNENENISEKPLPKLTNRQRAFIEHYLQTWNASLSARKAGYTGDSDTIGPRLLGNVGVRARIKQRLSELEMQSDEVLNRLGQMARANIGDFVIVDEAGSVTGLNADTVREFGYLIKRLEVDPDKIKIELYDGQAALVQIGKHLQLFTERVDLTSGGKPLQIVKIGIDPDKV